MQSVLLIVLDGFGIAPPGPGNSIYLANPTNINTFLYTYPNTTLKASGEAVGLPASEVGNTEVGHLNLGAGRVVYQDLPRINMAIADGTFYSNKSFLKAADHIKKNNSRLHLIGLVGEGVVHSCLEHLYALIYFAKEQKINNVYIHAITDGRDSPPKASAETIKRLEEKLNQNPYVKIASVSGRYYAMDRDRRWERTEKAYRCLTLGEGQKANSALEAIQNAYDQDKTDEFIEPTNIITDGKPIALIEKGDAVIFYNYRIDRPRQLTKAFVLTDFEKEANKSIAYDPYATKYHKSHLEQSVPITPTFQRGKKIEDLIFVTMTEYEKDLPADVAFPPIIVQMPLGRVLAENSIAQLRMSESEKERFVTFYFNGHREDPFPLEERLIIPSPKVPTYDLKPEMSAYEITRNLIAKMRENRFPFILVNFANPDMVGHTGNIQATIMAIKTIDTCLERIVQEALNFDYSVLITADHGNAEQKISPQTGEISTEHTANRVPFIVINKKYQGRFTKLQSGILADVAPTVLSLLGVSKPSDMTGRDLLEEIRED
jgi:2,3-bisphosphoglycerate-independent phosphoglycerate mutase